MTFPDSLTLKSCDVTQADLGPGIVERLPEARRAICATTPEEDLLEYLRQIRVADACDPLNAPLVSELRILLSAGIQLAAAIADNAIESGIGIPSSVAASATTALQAIAADLVVAQRLAGSEALPSLTTMRREIARVLPAPGGRP
jgi:hypothetical protein